MKFEISRVSDYHAHDESKPPCLGAFTEIVDGEPTWVVDLDSLDSLWCLVEREDECIISSCPVEWMTNTGLRGAITIYDDYIE